MMLPSQALQARRDRLLREKLQTDTGVQKALRLLDERSSGYGFVARRNLLTGALRLTRSMAPEIADSLAACKERLGVTTPVELYVRPEPVMNAFCVKPPVGHGHRMPVIVALSARLLETFNPKELQFVIGHELGHVLFDHFGIPMPHTGMIEDLAGRLVSPPTNLELYVWCRAAEISADRCGLVCAEDPEAGASAFFKLASGLASGWVRHDLDAFASQVDSLSSAPAARAEPRDDDDTLDCFSTHPYCAVRVRSLVAFARSKAYRSALGKTGGIADEDLEAVVERDLDLMAPSYLEEKTAVSQSLRRCLYTAGVVVAGANEVIAEAEVLALKTLLGADDTAGSINVEQARKELEGRIKEVEKAPLAQRAQLVSHLTIVAAADGHVEEAELRVMHDIAMRLGVDLRVIDQTLAGAAAPMD